MRWLAGFLVALPGLVLARYNDYPSEDGGDAFGLMVFIILWVAGWSIKEAFAKSRSRGWWTVLISAAGLWAFLEFRWLQTLSAAALLLAIVFGLINVWRRY